MNSLKIVLLLMTGSIIAFTAIVAIHGGIDLITPFFAAILSLIWQGQFNLDFTLYLVLSGIWMAWRTGFTAGGICLGIFAPPLGICLLSSCDGDAQVSAGGS